LRKTLLHLLLSAGVLFAAVLLLVLRTPWYDKSDLPVGEDFERVSLGTTLHMFSMGVVDFSNDSRLDIFTTNHNASALYLQNYGETTFEDRRFDLGLSGSEDFPDSEIAQDVEGLETPGLYIYWHRGTLNLVSRATRLDPPRMITLILSGGILAAERGAVEIVSRAGDPRRPTRLTVRVAGDGRLTLSSLGWTVFGRIELDSAWELEKVYVGQRRISPKEHSFDLSAGADRHGVAWTDLDADGHRDAIFVTGGESGQMREIRPYSVAFGTESGFAEPRAVAGLNQEMCPSRQITLADANGDGREDIYVVCGRGEPPAENHPHEVFLRQEGLAFANRAAALNLQLRGQGVVRWIDIEGDGAQELIWADAKEVRVLSRDKDRYETVLSIPHAGEKSQITVGDLEGDQDPDVYLASPFGASLVLRNDNGALTPLDPKAVGLPSIANCANFVDVDNDGRDDFHALPEGLFLAGGDGKFRANGLLAGGAYYQSFCQWFDADEDGYRDLLVALPHTETLGSRVLNTLRKQYEKHLYEGRVFRPVLHDISIFRNRMSGNSWLEVDLIGSEASPNGVGARVLATADGRVLVREAGHAEGGTRSNGHFRLYFGVGTAETIDLEVHWPDGHRQTFTAVEPNQRMTIVHPDRLPG
jgi:ASPIC and UnbV/FG-GAP-like repeat